MTISRVARTGSNIFEEIGFGPDEAENLRIRSQLMITIRQIIEEQALKQKDAAELFGTTQPRISDLVRGKIEQFTIDSLVNMLSQAGVPLELRVPSTG